MIPFFWHGPLRPPEEDSRKATRSDPELDAPPRGMHGLRQEGPDVRHGGSVFELREGNETPPEKTGASRTPPLTRE